jgi:hypothetical protein
MNAVDASFLLLLAFADICLIVHLRKQRTRRGHLERMGRALALWARRQPAGEALETCRPELLRRAS